MKSGNKDLEPEQLCEYTELLDDTVNEMGIIAQL